MGILTDRAPPPSPGACFYGSFYVRFLGGNRGSLRSMVLKSMSYCRAVLNDWVTTTWVAMKNKVGWLFRCRTGVTVRKKCRNPTLPVLLDSLWQPPPMWVNGRAGANYPPGCSYGVMHR